MKTKNEICVPIRDEKEQSESKKQSSIEWLVSLLKTEEEKEQAKQMHREEIEDAYISGYSATENNGDSTDYYNKTFKND